jgi:uncharacterized protein with von Willebrand factor type A (vWA) domain
MRKKTFKTIDEALAAFTALSAEHNSIRSDRVMKSTRLEDMIYADLRDGDEVMETIENDCALKLAALRTLPRDAFQCFYSLMPKQRDENKLSDAAKAFGAPVIRKMLADDEYNAIKSVCEGRRLPAYEAALAFSGKIAENLDELMKSAGGAPSALEKVEEDEKRLKEEIAALAERRAREGSNPTLDRKITEKSEILAAKARQAEALLEKASECLVQKGKDVESVVLIAINAAKDKADETAFAMAAWGYGNGGADPEALALNRDILEKVRQSETLLEITKHLGRFKEIADKARRNGYAFGRGEKYTVELGADIGRTLTSEFALLACPDTIPVFIKKVQTRRLKQYRRRDRIAEGAGDIIVCLDESGSARSEAAWGKAVTLTLLDIAMRRGRKFALVHFSHEGHFRTDTFAPGRYDASAVFAATECYLGGGTDFETPLKEALRLMEKDGFEKADIVFATDGVCSLSEEFRSALKGHKDSYGFRITGVLLDAESSGMETGLTGFCDEILRVSELSRERIAESLISGRA